MLRSAEQNGSTGEENWRVNPYRCCHCGSWWACDPTPAKRRSVERSHKAGACGQFVGTAECWCPGRGADYRSADSTPSADSFYCRGRPLRTVTSYAIALGDVAYGMGRKFWQGAAYFVFGNTFRRDKKVR